ncbi:50S ribosomal protein L15e [Candidatus Woesearchaeota archaeon CG11_big_fil_rev_8_21_14_0_20_43_8]|nr:MAG: 50S ribosomal protein L15e [Candidatus Woesearchaeota archaeon CG11_big_fil_rev_8_21_14_0_20_43_8]PIO04826.1 MAG: 50S ribosomal protein L15e [Candidatus Woesearchaeota archaeon CG08_land_8_20_14_0_20_43_7]
MGMYQYVRKLWKKPRANLKQDYTKRVSIWNKEDSTVRIERPTRLDRARALGYKAKQGIFVVRQKVGRSARMRPKPSGGRRSKHARRKKIVAKNYQRIAEERSARKYTNCEVLNSYWVGENATSKWYEIILVDGDHPRIKSDKNLSWVSQGNQTGRVFRGLTAAGRRSRGLQNKGKGAEKVRPSVNANKGRLH